MLTGMELLVKSVSWYVSATYEIVGAKMEDAKGVMKVMAERRPVMNHLRD
jgi:hypothetical protein